VILVTGATGHVGGTIVRTLTALGAPCRALVRSPERADDLRGYDVEIAIGEFDRPESLDDALRGVTSAFLASPVGPGQPVLERSFIDAAARAPSRPHVVKLASIGAAVDAPYGFGRVHGEIVEILRSSGLPHTVLAPNGFMQSFEAQALAIARDGVLATPGGDAAVSFVDVRDVAAVGARVLIDPADHAGAAYDITGPEALTYADVAAVFSRTHERAVRYVDVPVEQARAGMLSEGKPDWLAQGLLDLAAYYRSGAAAGVTDAVSTVTGRPARTLEAFVRDHPAVFAVV
jgi:uncharacterized protein YbjT (DUF2867 family)